MPHPEYPTSKHKQATEQIVDFFSQKDGVDGVLLVNSCARGKATPDSCLDIIILVSEHFRDPGYSSIVLERGENRGSDPLYEEWQNLPETRAVVAALASAGRFSEIHLGITDGAITPETLDRDEGLDGFELAIGNYFVYSKPLWLRTNRFHELQSGWLPYYSESLRKERLLATREFCNYYLDHIEPYVHRKLYFQAFDRLYQAFQGFLQGLFISRRVYPIAYNKWIREQVEEILGLPQLYAQLPGILEIHDLQSRELIRKGENLRQLTATYLVE